MNFSDTRQNIASFSVNLEPLDQLAELVEFVRFLNNWNQLSGIFLFLFLCTDFCRSKKKPKIRKKIEEKNLDTKAIFFVLSCII